MKTHQDSVHHHVAGERRRARFFVRAMAAGWLGATALVGAAESAQASTYNVYTSSISAMTLNANDGYCSLAEAVASANAGSAQYNCPDPSPGGNQYIQLIEAPGKPFASYHYTITSLTVNSPGRYVTILGIGASRPLIDTTGLSGFVVNSGSSVAVGYLNMTFTGGASGGRLVENYGLFSAYGVKFSKGNVTTHTYGRGGAIFNQGNIGDLDSDVEIIDNRGKVGGGIHNLGTINGLRATISGNTATTLGGGIYNKDGNIFISNATFSGNTATTLGGGIYNEDGSISINNATITSNTAKAGGGIYNTSTTNVGGNPKGQIQGSGAIINYNTAKAGGGLFNRGEVGLSGAFVGFNSATGNGTGESGETCAQGQSCDGKGGGVLNLSFTQRWAKVSLTVASEVSSNMASSLGGAAYSAGILNLWGLTIANNVAQSGGAIYAVAEGPSYYCSVGAGAGNGDTLIFNNSTSSSGGYSIVDTPSSAPLVCSFEENNGHQLEAFINSVPVCKASAASPACPQ